MALAGDAIAARGGPAKPNNCLREIMICAAPWFVVAGSTEHALISVDACGSLSLDKRVRRRASGRRNHHALGFQVLVDRLDATLAAHAGLLHSADRHDR